MTARRQRIFGARRLRLLGGLLAATAMTVTVCSCSTSGNAGRTATAIAQGSGANSPGSASSASCVTAAEREISAYTKPLHFTVPTAPIDVQKLQSKTLWMIVDAPLSNTLVLAEGFVDAAKAAGVPTHLYTGDATTTSYATGIEQALAQHAAGFALSGIFS